MFEETIKLWNRYIQQYGPTWPTDDPRIRLSREVEIHLNQLDRILLGLRSSITTIQANPEQARQWEEWIAGGFPLRQAGVITDDEYFAGFGQASSTELSDYFHSWDIVRSLSKVFYYLARRLLVILTVTSDRPFPRLHDLDVKGVKVVRHLLIEHLMKVQYFPYFNPGVLVTDDGPVVKIPEVLSNVATGMVTTTGKSIDKGLYVNADELRTELERALRGALSPENEE